MSKIIQFKLDFDQDLATYVQKVYPKVKDFRILSQSLDARGAPRGKKPVYLYQLEVIEANESFKEFQEDFNIKANLNKKPVIIGAGPAGLFCALRLAEYGIPSIIIERGEESKKRMLQISKYWRYGELNAESNVCYGEGGAGLFSDGKLITRIKSPYVKYVMQRFVDFGAPPETAYLSNPHLGSNKIRAIINKISDFLRDKGCELIYNTRVDELLFEEDKTTGVKLSDGRIIESDHIVLATGHSAREMYYHLEENKVAMKQKDFAVGVRIEHPRVLIDEIQHGQFFENAELGAAKYRLSYHDRKSDKGTYSFCMCPGGYVLSSGTDVDGIVVNGMSNYARNSRWSNSALVVSVKAGVDYPSDKLLAGLDFQNKIERKAFELSKKYATGRELPAMTVGEFLKGKLDSTKELPKTSSPSSLFKANLSEIFPPFIIEHLKFALSEFEHMMNGFSHEDALLIAPETRTSSPVTILRDKKSYESTSHKGLYPCGEGAGHAGGITSAAVDGIKVAMSIISPVTN